MSKFKRWLLALTAVATVFGVASEATPASASGYKVTAAPGGCINQTKWSTSSTTGSSETLYVATVGQCISKVNECRFGLSVWYTGTDGIRRNAYRENNGCVWGPIWSLSTPYFTAKRGTSVQVTFRWDGNWYNGFSFNIS